MKYKQPLRLRVEASASGFSLVEVVLAVGIVSVALLAVVALFSSAYQRRADTANLRNAMNSAGALVTFLRDEVAFPEVLDWARTGDAWLTYIPPGADTNLSGWYRYGDPRLRNVERLGVGGIVTAHLSWDDGQNVGLSSSPAPLAADDSSLSLLLFRAHFYAVPNPGFLPAESAKAVLEIPVTVRR